MDSFILLQNVPQHINAVGHFAMITYSKLPSLSLNALDLRP